MALTDRTKEKIESLHPNARTWALAFLEAVEKSGILPKSYRVEIISGHRSYEEQDILYAQGRKNKEPVVTNAPGGFSNHNFGIAFDIGIFSNNGKKYLTSSSYYAKLGPIGKKIGLSWGGDWPRFKDRPHYEVKIGKTLAQMRRIVGKYGDISKLDVPKYNGSFKSIHERKKLSVLIEGRASTIPAFVENGTSWVGIRRFTEEFGCVIVKATKKSFRIILDKYEYEIPGQIIDGTGYAKFRDINHLLELKYTYNNFGPTLNVLKE